MKLEGEVGIANIVKLIVKSIAVSGRRVGQNPSRVISFHEGSPSLDGTTSVGERCSQV